MTRLLPKVGWERRLTADPTLFFIFLLLFFAKMPPPQAQAFLTDPRQVAGSAFTPLWGRQVGNDLKCKLSFAF